MYYVKGNTSEANVKRTGQEKLFTIDIFYFKFFVFKFNNKWDLILIFCWPCISIYLFININQLDALNFIISLFHASTCCEHMCSSSGGQKLYDTVSGIITLKQVSGLKLLK